MFRNLEAEIRRHGLLKSKIAQHVGITQGTLSLKLNGKSNLTLHEAALIRDLIDESMSIEYLFLEDFTANEELRNKQLTTCS